MSDKNGAKDSIFARNKWLNIRGELRALDRPWVMGILNITPDSFYDGGEFLSTGDAIAQAEKMLHEGADIIDLGASSTRPGAKKIPASEEINRLKPMLKEIRQKFPDAVISVDTYQADVARAAADLGADMINDISGGTLDPSMPETIGDLGLPYILMHLKGTPANMQQNPHYRNVLKEVMQFFSAQLELFLAQGANDIILDPGFGFAKKLEHNYELLAQLDQLKMFDRPILVGVSRKSMINKLTGRSAQYALNGTSVVHTLALQNGANLLRVHDVREAVEVVKILTFTQKFT